MESINEIRDIFRKKGAIEILLFISIKGRARYSELRNVVDSETSLIRSLKFLCEKKYLKREIVDDKYRPTEYEITEKGKAIANKIREMLEIVEKNI